MELLQHIILNLALGLHFLFDYDKYYHIFIKGMLQYLELCFDNNYLYQHLEKKYFQKIDKPKFYIVKYFIFHQLYIH